MSDPVSRALLDLQRAFEELRIPFCIGGSYASSARGEPRATMDVDVVAGIDVSQADSFAAALGSGWSVDAEAIREAFRRARAFNIFCLYAGLKFDIFPAFDAFQAGELERATMMALMEGAVRCPVATTEDMVLAKLQWYRAGGEVSERQWRDILGLLRAGAPLDASYLSHWAKRLAVEDLLNEAIAAAARE